jgi:D-alanyl-D-alanine carboxypeptidase
VVFGGRTGRARDAKARSLIDNNINLAATVRTAPPIAEGTAMAEMKLPAKPPTPTQDPRENDEQVVANAPELGSTAPIKPTAVKTVNVQPGPVHTAALSPLPSGSRKLMPAPATAKPASVTTIATLKSDLPPPPVGAAPGVLGVLSAKEVEGSKTADKTTDKTTKLASTAANVPMPTAEATAKARGGWMIQVGAFDDEQDAKKRLTAAQTTAKSELGQADPFTEKVAKGNKQLYSARFAGLDKSQAETACKNLKRSEIPCMLLRN